METFGFFGVGSNLFKFANNPLNSIDAAGAAANTQVYEAQLLKKFGGMVEGQYYFNNQWFVNAVYGWSKAYGVSRARFNFPPGVCKFATKIKDITRPQNNIHLQGTVKRLFPAKNFTRNDNSEGKVLRFHLADETGEIAVVGWNVKAEELSRKP